MNTQCPNCKTVFRVHTAHLEAALGRAHCGVCQHVFNAVLNLYKMPAGSEKNTEVSQKTSSNEVDVIEENQNVHESSPDVIDYGVDRATSELTDDKNDSKEDSGFASNTHSDESNDEIPAFILEEIEKQRLNNDLSVTKKIGWILGIILLLLVLILQYIYWEKKSLSQSSSTREYVIELCKWVGCEVPAYVSVSEIQLLERSMVVHPHKKNALLLTGSMMNTASMAQAYPYMQISFSDLTGRLVKLRRFLPKEYLINASEEEIVKGIALNKPVQFELELIDPELRDYQIDFL